MIDENRKYDRPGVVEVKKFLLRLHHYLGGILSSNYDLLVEYALGTRGFNYGIENEILTGRGPYPVSQWKNPVRLTGTIPLAKLHGSISWNRNGHYTDGRGGLTGNALIVPPISTKSMPELLQQQWALSEQILAKSNKLLVFGFAFNSYDSVLLEHLMRFGKSLKSIALIDIVSNIEKANLLWPEARVEWIQPPPEGDEKLRIWLRTRTT